jgi:hypothetical protein
MTNRRYKAYRDLLQQQATDKPMTREEFYYRWFTNANGEYSPELAQAFNADLDALLAAEKAKAIAE